MKKIVMLILATLVSIICVFGLTACGDKQAPTLSIEIINTTCDSVEYSLKLDDPDQVMAIESVILVYEESMQELHVSDTAIIPNLYADTDYNIVVTYTYDLGDGIGKTTKEVSQSFKTKAYVKPTFDFELNVNQAKRLEIVSIEYDPDNIGNIVEINILQNGEIVATSKASSIDFTVNENEFYSVSVLYEYDLHTADGIAQTTVFKDYGLKIADFQLENTGGLKINDTLYSHVQFYTNHNLLIKKIVVNNKSYDVVDNGNHAFDLSIPVDEQYNEGGSVDFIISNVIAEFNNELVTIYCYENNTITPFIFGTISVEGFDVVNSEGEIIDCVQHGDSSNYFQISLNNKSGYRITGIQINSSNKTDIIDKGDNLYWIKLPMYNVGMQNYTLEKIYYSFNNDEKVLVLGDEGNDLLILTLDSMDVVLVKTVEDLKSMTNSCCYILNNDIDLAGIEWKPNIDFVGYFDGNNHTIKNMNYVNSFEDEYFSGGLFRSVNGVVKNLTITGKYKITTSNNTSQYISVGGLCSSAKGGLFENITTDVDIEIIGEKNHRTTLGGIIAETDIWASYKIVNCTNNGDIIGGDTVGGIIGDASDGTEINVIRKCINNGNLCGSFDVGGIVGESPYSSALIIEQSANCGSITTARSGGGIISDADNSVTIRNCYNVGDIIYDNRYYEPSSGVIYISIGGLVGASSAKSIESCYSTGRVYKANAINGDHIGIGAIIGSSWKMDWETYNIYNVYSTDTLSAVGNAVYGQMPSVMVYSNYNPLNNKTFIEHADPEIWDLQNIPVSGNPVFLK